MTKTAGQLLYEASPEAQHQAPWSSLPHWEAAARAVTLAYAQRIAAESAAMEAMAAELQRQRNR
jgi:hypothetical protein